uniref:Uncharacterized protein n=1 Tax=Chenopodium quinoa TaxID=63459 RepID=A0A803MYI3_CHEQI
LTMKEVTEDLPGVEGVNVAGDKSKRGVAGKRIGPTEKNIPEKSSTKRKGEGVEPYQGTFMNELFASGIGGVEQFEDSNGGGSDKSQQASEYGGGSDEQGSEEDEELQHLERKISKGKAEAGKLKKKMAKAREAKLINAVRARAVDNRPLGIIMIEKERVVDTQSHFCSKPANVICRVDAFNKLVDGLDPTRKMGGSCELCDVIWRWHGVAFKSHVVELCARNSGRTHISFGWAIEAIQLGLEEKGYSGGLLVDDDDVLYFRTAFLVALLGQVLCPSTDNGNFSISLVSAVAVAHDAELYNWAEFSHDWLMAY